MNKRRIEIDTLRGLACILLVAFHVVGVDVGAGLQLDSGFYRNISDALIYVRMPLFTFLSGIVYAYRPFSTGFLAFVKSKARRLLLPMLTVGTLFAVMQAMASGENDAIENWWTLHLYPVAHFWFVEAIFSIFLVVAVCEMFNLFKSIKTGFLILLLSAALYLSDIYIRIFALSGAIYLAPFFLVGMMCQRYDYFKYLSVPVGFLVLTVPVLLIALVYFDVIPDYHNRTIFGLCVGVLCCCALLSLRLKAGFLAAIGRYSYSIYIFHVFFSAASRMVMHSLNVYEVNALFAIGLVLGIGGPIFVEHVLNGTNITRVAFLGARPLTRDKLWLTRQLRKKPFLKGR